jgi:hypothetical protein
MALSIDHCMFVAFERLTLGFYTSADAPLRWSSLAGEHLSPGESELLLKFR